ncbi:CHC2 zinc finger domain-containing protein [Metamycoplasma equirhinis]|uniref:CHC2 zinc finger domain-containing protein n=1 Tax=Metamycoplasma equirhinis TaxID=92402 RepID=UPI00359C6558
MNKELIWDEVKSKINIINLIEEFIPLQKKGANFVACCPFHSEKTPSFVVNNKKQIY